MSREVLATISHTYDLASYSTTELRTLFNEWLIEVERLIKDFINKRNRVDPDELAHHFKLKRDSVVFILRKLDCEGSITMPASKNERCKIRPLRIKE